MMTPLNRFLNGLHSVRNDFNVEMDELIAFAEVLARKQNALELDDQGFFYVTASGPIEEVIPTMEK